LSRFQDQLRAALASTCSWVAVCNAYGIEFKGDVDALAPLGVYSIPELAMVGMTEEQVRAEEI
jgi:pyruvate/2-oxoglutarate dehydrogenase complex dihydrolipoamide dehydrogenase (E3) component